MSEITNALSSAPAVRGKGLSIGGPNQRPSGIALRWGIVVALVALLVTIADGADPAPTLPSLPPGMPTLPPEACWRSLGLASESASRILPGAANGEMKAWSAY